MPVIRIQIESQLAAANFFTPLPPDHQRPFELANTLILREVISKSGASL